MSDVTRIYVCEGDRTREATEFFFIESTKDKLHVIGNGIEVADVMGAALQACFDEGATRFDALRILFHAWRRSHAKE
jgi:hypothetical protein